jgi:hypothetical protein
MPELRIFEVSAKIWVDEATAEGSVLQQIEKEQCVRVANVEQVLRLPPVLKVYYVSSEGWIFQQSLVGQVCNEAQDKSQQQSKERMSTFGDSGYAWGRVALTTRTIQVIGICERFDEF